VVALTKFKGFSWHLFIPDFFIDGCKDEEFSSYKFNTPEGQKPVEGHWIQISYRRPNTAPEMSGLEMIRNYTNAITEIGGTVLGASIRCQGRHF